MRRTARYSSLASQKRSSNSLAVAGRRSQREQQRSRDAARGGGSSSSPFRRSRAVRSAQYSSSATIRGFRGIDPFFDRELTPVVLPAYGSVADECRVVTSVDEDDEDGSGIDEAENEETAASSLNRPRRSQQRTRLPSEEDEEGELEGRPPLGSPREDGASPGCGRVFCGGAIYPCRSAIDWIRCTAELAPRVEYSGSEQHSS